MNINNEILNAITYCKYKAFLKTQNFQNELSDFQSISEELKRIQKEKYKLKTFTRNSEFVDQSYITQFQHQRDTTYFDFTFKNDKIRITIDGIQFLEKKKIIPIFITPFEKISKQDKLFIALQSYFIQQEFGLKIEAIKIIYGINCKQTITNFTTISKGLRKTILDLAKQENSKDPPIYYKNEHCQICEFNETCSEQLKARDDLSLLRSLSIKEIEHKNNKGIFSIKQLSYTFKPKKHCRRKFLPELKALAIREQKTFILGDPTFKQVITEIYFDIEGLPDRNFYYLIGLIIKTANDEKEYSFWANNKEEEQSIFIQFINLVSNIDDFVVYHYGSYEIQALKNISKTSPEDCKEIIRKIIENSSNLLTIFSNDVYPPTYSNGLKDISNFLNFYWTESKASGLQSIVWRYRWELTLAEELKQTIINYNIEDCRALKIVKDWISIIPESGDKKFEFAKNVKVASNFKWGKANFLIKEFEQINRFAYFNYQREKVLIKSYPKIGLQQKKYINSIQKLKPNKIIELQRPKICLNCKCEKFYRHDIQNRIVIDLKISKTGIKRIVTLYKNARYKCVSCKSIVMPRDEINIRSHYGKTLNDWIINQIVLYRISYKKICAQLKESFNIDLVSATILHAKSQYARYYEPTFQEIIRGVKSSNVIHIDETIFHVRNETSYIWVFTSIDAVFYLYKPTREADFLRELLIDFKGVLISDFYAGYDALNCPKQRCLIHLIRDLNDDLVLNQMNNEFKIIVLNFSLLLTDIINTVNKYGLKKRNLNKHKKSVEHFFNELSKIDFESEICLKWQKRFSSSKNELFTFLDYNGVPWNNNNAETAIKAVALYRRDYDGLPTKKGIQEYLTLLSIQQTCKYQGLNFFKFLRSGSTNLCTD